MRLAFALTLLAAPAFALPSGLADPLASSDACAAFAAEIETGAADPVLAGIAFDEGRLVHGLHTEDAKLASDVLASWQVGGSLPSDAVAVYVSRVCRSL